MTKTGAHRSGMANTAVKEVQITHVVKSGQRLSDIARKYGVTVSDIKTWNYIGKKGLRSGKKLTIYIQKPTEEKDKIVEKNVSEKEDTSDNKKLAENSKPKKSETKSGSNTSNKHAKYHIIKSGESLYLVSKKYGVSVNDLLKLNGLSKNSILSIGQKIRIR